MTPSKLGLIQVYTGEGKGKTSASLGLSLRAIGQGFSTYIIQFMKSGDTGELFSVKKYIPNIKIAQFGKDALADKQSKMFEFDGTGDTEGTDGRFIFLPDAAEREPARRALEHAANIIKSGKYNLVVLDEINCALAKNLIESKDVIRLLDEKPDNVEVVLTGRNAPQAIMDRADYVSEIKQVKHPWEQGIGARRGIEY
ncbi:cob(I)yrinic acid a,c-diamide adenosyltransferase [Candidatus Woesearchaeota archaeon]|nr:cob(I)yrinic acid a,c-diamide adenosyltransferase [Candidatus Woesearchaeota archaeon]MBW3005237.1 cob(I)yrinic acid a,c-diamide adenosyltransferase [Candidatus Woesearchaeota archaeon]